MPRIGVKKMSERIREIEVGKNLWVRVNYPGFENGGLFDIYRYKEDKYQVTVWDAHNDRSHWKPHNDRTKIYNGFIQGVLALVKEHRKRMLD